VSAGQSSETKADELQFEPTTMRVMASAAAVSLERDQIASASSEAIFDRKRLDRYSKGSYELARLSN
jgi:hypothetical protein